MVTGKHKIEPPHQKFIIDQCAHYCRSSKKIAKMLGDPEVAAENGFEPITISQPAVWIHIKNVSNVEIEKARADYLADWSDLPLAHKKPRVIELVKMFEALDNADYNAKKPLTDLGKDREKRKILNQIKEEIGEDLNKLAEAMGSASAAALVMMNRIMEGYHVPGPTSDTEETQD